MIYIYIYKAPNIAVAFEGRAPRVAPLRHALPHRKKPSLFVYMYIFFKKKEKEKERKKKEHISIYLSLSLYIYIYVIHMCMYICIYIYIHTYRILVRRLAIAEAGLSHLSGPSPIPLSWKMRCPLLPRNRFFSDTGIIWVTTASFQKLNLENWAQPLGDLNFQRGF